MPEPTPAPTLLPSPEPTPQLTRAKTPQSPLQPTAQPTPLPSADADARIHFESSAFPNAIAKSHINASPVELPNNRAETLANAAPYLNTLSLLHMPHPTTVPTRDPIPEPTYLSSPKPSVLPIKLRRRGKAMSPRQS
jgi:hypothetical protein